MFSKNIIKKSLNELSEMQIRQMKNKGCLPENKEEVILHLVEEVGELCECIREKKGNKRVKEEVADILWQLNKFCWINNFDLEKIFLKKLNKNKKR